MRKGRMASWRTMALAGLAIVLPLPAPAAGGAAESERVKIESVEVAVSTVGPVVLLKALGKVVPVLVDQTVAQSIHAALNGQPLPRPLTHDLMRAILSGYGAKVTQVVVTLKGTTYYGALSVEMQGETKVFDSRSSDAIALAIHFAAPILVGRELVEKAGQELPAAPGSQRL